MPRRHSAQRESGKLWGHGGRRRLSWTRRSCHSGRTRWSDSPGSRRRSRSSRCPGRCGRRGERKGWSGRWRVTLKDELPHHLPFEPDEHLHFVYAGQPFLRGRFPFRESESAGFAVPWDRFIMDEFAAAKPKRSPLCLGSHLIIREDRAHIGDRVLKNSRGCKFPEVLTVKCELKRTEHRVGIRSHNAFEYGFDRERDERRQGDGGCISDRGCIGDGGRERNCRRERNGR